MRTPYSHVTGSAHVAAVVFDFDGTLVDSGDIKQRAYRAAIRSVLEPPVEALEQAYRAHGTLNRVKQLDAAFNELAGRRPTAAELETLLAAYGEVVEGERHTVVPFAGMAQLLDRLRPHAFLAIASNAPQHEVEASCSQLELASYFDAIYGFPLSKEQAIEAVRAAAALPRSALTYVGDRREDGDVARRAGVRFLRFGPLEAADGSPILRDVRQLTVALDIVE